MIVHGFSISSASFGSFFRNSAPSGAKETGRPMPGAKAKGEHLARIDSVRLLMTFKMCKSVALVGTANVHKYSRRCSGRAGIGGGGSSVLVGVALRIRKIKNFSIKQNRFI